MKMLRIICILEMHDISAKMTVLGTRRLIIAPITLFMINYLKNCKEIQYISSMNQI